MGMVWGLKNLERIKFQYEELQVKFNMKKFKANVNMKRMTLKPKFVFNWIMFLVAIVCNFKR